MEEGEKKQESIHHETGKGVPPNHNSQERPKDIMVCCS